MNTKRRRFLLILSLVLLVAASGSLNPAAASSVDVFGYDTYTNGGTTFDYDVGTTYDSMLFYGADGNKAIGEASTLGTVKLYAYSGHNIIEAHANIRDTYTFTNLDSNDATGAISGLCLKLSYSGFLSYGDGSVEFQTPGGWVKLTYDGANYVIDTYAAYTGGGTHTYVYSSNPTNSVSGEFIKPIIAEYGKATDISLSFAAIAVTAGNGDSFADFYNTANFSFYADGICLGVTSEGGFNNVPLPPTVWLFGSGLLGLVGWRRFRKG